MRVTLITAAVFLMMFFLVGCPGDTRHDVSTGENGSLYGLMISPEPQSLEIDTNEDFFLDWTYGTTPPGTFHVTLESVENDGTRTGVYTRLETIRPGHYRLIPTMSLPSEEFLFLKVVGEGESVRAMYLTENGAFLGNTRKAQEGEKGQIEHTVITRQAQE